MDEKKIEKEVDRMARELCAAFNVRPGDTVPSGSEPKFAAYAGDTYYQWARDQVEIFMAIFQMGMK